ncbi:MULTISPECIES: serine kinase [unclassified Mesorhizobium]|uniref:serine kinase n=1 Tax=unclassified Mesorhizobium TaxID=325217 RepID=UPI000BAEA887|nr:MULTISPECIES: serine kinase [unclassified Mesorhizobium]TGT60858.1 serine kinase [Mesorhizobium sp. M00.F.Ca.ET.170.01.1.1]AZO10039.1 serine kinase [Mesorhizobium sp. M3A.F.Ca.ET.080.04.2.1]PBB86499.1 serine kinase [Mesorhizobium sp. WSM3876]RWB75725.1 MAG: serine kinase [Mesorhizobium sp.]RWB91478.1 MAG: serine kinase [Mesorhizobium sp.]
MTASAASVCYDLNGRVFGVDAPRPELWRDFEAMLGSLRLAAPAKPGFRLSISETQSLDEAPEGSLAFDGEVPLDGHCRMIDAGSALHLIFPGRQAAAIHAADAKAEIRVLAGARVLWTLGMLALDAALDAGSQHMLHTAGLTLPDRDGVILIHAPSGTGKSTTSLALTSQGFGLCSDDAMIVDAASSAPLAWGLPRAAKIHRNTAAMLPFVLPCLGGQWDGNGEQAVSLERLKEIIRIEDAGARPVAALLHLARAADGQTRLIPMARTDAMVALAADNVRTGMTGLLAMQKRRMATIAALVKAVPTFTLEVGASPADAAALILAALAR